ncbi:hypothetical protein HON22_04605 [Candidatus Peregrinibacteria bacterium]|jgi:hypothetical protein|nr:hypothetical protein [Candidatus Peregrinibacteria bacterium]
MKERAPLQVSPPYNLLTEQCEGLDSFGFNHINNVIMTYNYIQCHPEKIREQDIYNVLVGLRRYLRLWLYPSSAKHVGVKSHLEGNIDERQLRIQRTISYNKWVKPYTELFHDKIMETMPKVKNPYPEEDLGLVMHG